MGHPIFDLGFYFVEPTVELGRSEWRSDFDFDSWSTHRPRNQITDRREIADDLNAEPAGAVIAGRGARAVPEIDEGEDRSGEDDKTDRFCEKK